MTPSARALLGGGIGSGKSTAAARFAALGAEVLSADRAAHAVLEPGAPPPWRWRPAGPRRWWRGGSIGRTLAGIVFADPAERIALEDITHPAIGRLLGAQVAGVGAGVLLVEMPLPIDLLGPGWRWVVVDAPDEVRRARLLAGHGGGRSGPAHGGPAVPGGVAAAGRPGRGQRRRPGPSGAGVPPGLAVADWGASPGRRYRGAMTAFRVVSDFAPAGDQPEAMAALAAGVERGDRFQTLLGVTGSGKTFTMANLIERCSGPPW